MSSSNKNLKPSQCPDTSMAEMIQSMVTFTNAANSFLENSKKQNGSQDQEKLQCILNNISMQMQELLPQNQKKQPVKASPSAASSYRSARQSIKSSPSTGSSIPTPKPKPKCASGKPCKAAKCATCSIIKSPCQDDADNKSETDSTKKKRVSISDEANVDDSGYDSTMDPPEAESSKIEEAAVEEAEQDKPETENEGENKTETDADAEKVSSADKDSTKEEQNDEDEDAESGEKFPCTCAAEAEPEEPVPCSCVAEPDEEGDTPCCCDMAKECTCAPLACDFSESPILKVKLLQQLKKKLADAELNLADLQCQISILTDSLPCPMLDICKKRPYAAIYQEIMRETPAVDEIISKECSCQSKIEEAPRCPPPPPPPSTNSCSCSTQDPPLTTHYLNPNASNTNRNCGNTDRNMPIQLLNAMKQIPPAQNAKEKSCSCTSTNKTTSQTKCPPLPRSQTTIIHETIEETIIDQKKKEKKTC